MEAFIVFSVPLTAIGGSIWAESMSVEPCRSHPRTGHASAAGPRAKAGCMRNCIARASVVAMVIAGASGCGGCGGGVGELTTSSLTVSLTQALDESVTIGVVIRDTLEPYSCGTGGPFGEVTATLDGAAIPPAIEEADGYSFGVPDTPCGHAFSRKVSANELASLGAVTIEVTDETGSVSMVVLSPFAERSLIAELPTASPGDDVTLTWSPATDVLVPNSCVYVDGCAPDLNAGECGGDCSFWPPATIAGSTVTVAVPADVAPGPYELEPARADPGTADCTATQCLAFRFVDKQAVASLEVTGP